MISIIPILLQLYLQSVRLYQNIPRFNLRSNEKLFSPQLK